MLTTYSSSMKYCMRAAVRRDINALKIYKQGMRDVSQHGKRAKYQRMLLAMVEEQLRGAGGPMNAAYFKDLKHEVDENLIAVPAWSATVTKARLRFSQMLR